MNYNYKHLKVLILFFITCTASAQLEFKGEATLKGIVSANEQSPFWMHSNQRGRVTDSTNLATWISAKGVYELNENATFEIGGGLLHQDATNKAKINIDELYGQYKNSWLQIIGGRKQHEELYNGLSATNGNFIWSLNARPLPGIQISTVEPIYFLFNKSLGLSGSWNEFHMYKNRYVKNTLLHNKSLYLNYRNDDGLKIMLGIQHFVQWGGTSPDPNIGKQPMGFSDFIRVVTGHDGGDNSLEGDQENALGNHLGSFELRVNKSTRKLEFEFLYSHFFEDGSGMAMYNLLDGRYGVYANFKEKFRWTQTNSWIESAMYEFYYTKDQSHNLTPWKHLWDNYFNNWVYRSGWTYNGQVIGVPFFTTNSYDGDPITIIGNNRVLVHHFGFNGFAFHKFPYKLLISYRNNNGRAVGGDDNWRILRSDDPSGKIKIPHEVISSYLDIRFLESFINLNLEIGVDASRDEVNLGAGIKLNKQF